mgnify:CR=1 FL=1
MKKLSLLLLGAVLTLSLYSCRETTEEKTEDAVEAVGNDIESNTEAAGNEIEGAAQDASNEMNEEVQGTDDVNGEEAADDMQ